ncbi:hypothetical protein [Aeromicrobium wangtongii]|uniref:Lipoprotein LprG n=1 Tax=Aeromicrobium wangtongii TaxID=2969247 RepID=A0ABY5M677_9ACTN|nr:hypothetical protein [Aeromicrobium wangtongii]MCD9199309.1 hypothetical protein [Aeromicrobium wangtongii]UUP13670.1 hypothetical protein NQV15_17745 [Aeromicrobium wangtongii]
MNMTRLAASALAVTLLAGCGGTQTSGLDLPEYHGSTDAPGVATQSPGEVLAASKAALAAADSVSIMGQTSSPDGTLAALLAFSGQDGSGTYSFGAGAFQLLMVGGRTWWKGDAQAYAGFDYDLKTVTRKIADRWIIAGTSHPRLARIDVPTSREELLDDIVDPGTDGLTADETTIDGAKVIGLTTSTGTLYVEADTKLPVRLVFAGDAGDGVQFSYEPVPTPSPPPPDRMLDLSDLR